MTSSPRTMTFKSRFENLANIAEFIRQSAQDAGLDQFATYAVETAVDEACSNIIEHAYGGNEDGEIECSCIINLEGLTIILRDQGKPFDPSSVGIPDPNAPLDERPGHGLGLFFMNEWMDEVRFDFKESGNVLTMVKRKEKKD